MARVVSSRRKKARYSVSMTTGTRSSAPVSGKTADEFSRFENLASKLVRVPKSETDEKRKKP